MGDMDGDKEEGRVDVKVHGFKMKMRDGRGW